MMVWAQRTKKAARPPHRPFPHVRVVPIRLQTRVPLGTRFLQPGAKTAAAHTFTHREGVAEPRPRVDRAEPAAPDQRSQAVARLQGHLPCREKGKTSRVSCAGKAVLAASSSSSFSQRGRPFTKTPGCYYQHVLPALGYLSIQAPLARRPGPAALQDPGGGR